VWIAGRLGRLAAFAQEDADSFSLSGIERFANETRLVSAHPTIRDFFIQAYGQEVHWQPSTTSHKIGMFL
jgi:hypothetical protein